MVKTALAAFIAVVLACGVGLSSLPAAAQALPNTEQTAFVWYTIGGTKGGFDIKGVQNGSPSIQTSYANNGYQSVIKVDSQQNNQVKWTNNGQTQNIFGLNVTQTLQVVNDDAYIRISYTVENPTAAPHTVSLGNWTDVQIGNDDTAPIKSSATGAIMSNSKGQNAQFNIICKNAYGVTDVDTLWFGQYGQSANNIFSGTKTSSVSGIDSGIAISWMNRVIPAGEKRTFSYLLGIGENAAPPEISGEVNVKVNPQTVDVSAKVKDVVGRTDRLYYVLDMGTELETEPAVLDTHKFTSNSFVDMKGQIQRPATWQVGEVHTVSVWVMNEANAMSPIVTKVIVIKDDEEEGDVMQEGVNVNLHFKPGSSNGVAATGTPPADAQVFELQEVELPQNTFTPPTVNGVTLKFAGWMSEDGKMYQPGAKFTMPERTTIIDAATRTNYDFTAVWMSNGESIYYVDVYLQQKDGTYKKKQEVTFFGKDNTRVSISDKIDEFQQEGYKLNNGKSTISGTVSPITSGTPLRLALYYDLLQYTLTFDVDGMPGQSNSKAMLYYNTSLKDSTTASMRTLPDTQWVTFDGWFNRTNGKGAQLTEERRIKANETYYAHWAPKLKQMSFDYNYQDIAVKPSPSAATKPLEETRAEGSYANVGVKLAADGMPAKPADWTDDNGKTWRFDKWVVDGKQVVGGRSGRMVEVTADTVFRVDQASITATAQWFEVFPVSLSVNDVDGGTASLKATSAAGADVTLNAAANDVPVSLNVVAGNAAQVTFAPKPNHQVAHVLVNGVVNDASIGEGRLILRDIRQVTEVKVEYVKSPTAMTFDYAYVDEASGRVPEDASLASTPPALQGLLRDADRPGEGIYQNIALKTSGMPATPADWKDKTGKFWRFDGWETDGSFVIGGEADVPVKVDENTRYTVRYNAEAPLGYDDIAAHATWREVLPLTATCSAGGKVARVDADTNETITSPYHEIGSNVAVTFVPNAGYLVKHVMVDGVWDDSWIELGRVELPDYRQAHAVHVEFAKDPSFDPEVKEIGTIRFDANGGAGTPSAISGEVGSSTSSHAFPLATPVRNGYVFNGWNTQADGKGIDVAAYPASFVKGTTVYYAKWEKVDVSKPDPAPQPGVQTGYVKFSANGGKGTPAAISGEVGTPITGKTFPVMVPNRDGYVFDGWNTEADGSGATVTAFPAKYPLGTVTYYARWIEMGLSPDPDPQPGDKLGFVKFDANGGSGAPAGLQGKAGSPIADQVFPGTVPVRSGYVFEGWNTAADGTGDPVTAYPAAYPADGSTVMIYAKWSRAQSTGPVEPSAQAAYIKFNANGGTGTPAGVAGSVGDAISNPFPATVPQKGTDVFLGWFTQPTGGEAVTSYPAKLETPGTVYYHAHWQPASTPAPVPPADPDNERITISFDANGGNGTPDYVEGEAGERVTASWPALIPNRPGHVFLGWFTEPADGEGSRVSAYPAAFPDDDVVYHAHWQQLPAPDPDNPDPGPAPDPAPTPTDPDDPRVVSIMFDANGGNGTPVNIDGAPGSSTAGNAWPSLVPLRQGYVFDGWHTAASGGTLVTALPAVFPASDTTYHAHWLPAASSGGDSVPPAGDTFGHIKFDAHGGNGAPAQISGKSGDPISQAWPTIVPNRDGYAFMGWFDAAEGGNEVQSFPATLPVDNTVIYHAHWQKISGSNPAPDPEPEPTNPDDAFNVSIMFSANGGNGTPANIDGAAGQPTTGKVWPAAVPQRAGHVFDGWYDAPEGGARVAGLPETFPMKDVTYYAHWIAANPAKPDPAPTPGKQHGYIKFDVTGGYGAPQGISGEVGSSTSAHAFPTGTPLKTGYVFNGWNTEPDGSGVAVSSYPSKFAEGTTYYYAQWVQINDPRNPDPAPGPGAEVGFVKFNANGGSGAPEGISGPVGSAPASRDLPVLQPQRAGHVFTGWNTKADGTGADVTAYPATFAAGTTIYHAQWKKVDPATPDPAPTPTPTPGADETESYFLFDANGGAGAPAQIAGVAGTPTDGVGFPLQRPVRTGFAFAGWNTAADGTGEPVTALPATFPGVSSAGGQLGTTVTYYAQWQKVDPAKPDPAPTPGPSEDPMVGSFSFDAHGGTGAPVGISGQAGASVDQPFPGNIPLRNGYSFAGWNTEADGSGALVKAYPATFPDGETVVFHAQWKKVDVAKPDPAPTPGEQPGYFMFDPNGGQGTHPGISGKVGASTAGVAFPSIVPQRVGFVFNGWNTKADGTGSVVTALPQKFPKGTVTYYAQWVQVYNPAEPDPAPEPGVQTGYIKFNANGGNGTPAGIEGAVGSSIDKAFPAMVPVKQGKVFAGWNTKADGSGKTVASYPAQIPEGTTIYYARWVDPVTEADKPATPEPADAHIKFNANGGSGAPAGISGKEGESTAGSTFPTLQPVRQGHVFSGWNTQADGAGEAVAAYPATFSAGTTIYHAQWQKVDPATPDPAPTPTPTPGFDGPESFLLFDANGGSGTPAQISGKAGASTTGNAFPVLRPVRDGHVFAGWNTAADGSGVAVTKLPAKFPGADPADPTKGTTATYYAQWQPVDPATPDPAPTPGPSDDKKTGSFAFDAQGGSGAPAAVSGASGATVRVEFPGNIPVKDGFAFNGWNTMADGTGDAVSAFPEKYPSGATVVYYAQWVASSPATPDPAPMPEPETGHIKFDVNGGYAAPDKVSGVVGSAVSAPFPVDVPLRKNHSFNGWNTKADGTGAHVSAFDGDLAAFKAGTTILYAQWIQTAKPEVPVDDSIYYTIQTVKHGSTHATVTKTHSVARGAESSVSWKPDAGYVITEVTVNGIQQKLEGDGTGSVTFKNVTSNHEVVVYVEKKPDTPVDPSQPTQDESYVKVNTQIVGPGTIDPSATVKIGSSYTVSWKPNAGYEVSRVFINGAQVNIQGTSLVLGRYTFESLAADATIKVVLKQKGASTDLDGKPGSHVIETSIHNGEGTITPTTTLVTDEQKKRHEVVWNIDVAQTVGSQTGTSYPKYEVRKVEVDKKPVELDGTTVRTFTSVDKDHSVDVYLIPQLINVDVNIHGKGTASPNATLFVGEDYEWFAKAADGWKLQSVKMGDQVLYQAPGTRSVTTLAAGDVDAGATQHELTENKVLDVVFVRTDGTAPDPTTPTYDVSVELSGGMGTVASNYTAVAAGDDRTVSWTAGEGYRVKKVVVDRGGVAQSYSLPDFTSLDIQGIETDVNVKVELEAYVPDKTDPGTPDTVDPDPTPTDPDDPTRVSIMFNANGGHGAPANIDGEANAAMTATFPNVDPSRTGYAFAGWFTAKSGGAPVTALPATFPATNTTYYAHWLKNPDPVKPPSSSKDERYDLTTHITTGQGSITETTRQVVKGEKVTVSWTANAGSYVSKVVVDGVERPDLVCKQGDPASKRGLLSAGSLKLTMNRDHDVTVTLVDSPALDLTVNGKPSSQMAVITYGDPITPRVDLKPYGLPQGAKVVYHYTPVDDEGAVQGPTTTKKPSAVGCYTVYATCEGERDSQTATLRIVPRPITIEATYPRSSAPAGIQLRSSLGAVLTADSYGYRLAEGKVLTASGLKSGDTAEVKTALKGILGKVTSKTYRSTSASGGELAFAKPLPGTYRLQLGFANVDRNGKTYASLSEYLSMARAASEGDLSTLASKGSYHLVGNYLVRFVDKDIKITKDKLKASVHDASGAAKAWFTQGDAYSVQAKLQQSVVGSKEGVTFKYAKKTAKGGFEQIGSKPTAPGEYLAWATGDPRCFDDADPVPFTIYAKDDPLNPVNPDNPYRDTRHIEVAAKFAYPAVKAGFNVASEPYSYQMVPGYSLLKGDTLEGLLGNVTYTCKTATGVTLDRANPKAGVYTLTPQFSKLAGVKPLSDKNGVRTYKVGDYQITVRSFTIAVVPEPAIPDNPKPEVPELPEKPDPGKGDPTPPAGTDVDLSYIKFDANGGFNAPAGIEGDPGALITSTFPVDVPSVPGYLFTGWNTLADGTGEAVEEYPARFSVEPGTTRYYAQWKRDPSYVPPAQDPKPAKKQVYLVARFDPSVAKAGADISANPYQVFAVPGFEFAKGDTLESVAGTASYQCRTEYGSELDRTSPIAGDYKLRPLFAALGEPIDNGDGTYRYETDEYVITVMPQAIHIEPERFNDEYEPKPDPESSHDLKVIVDIVDGVPQIEVTDNGKPLPDGWTTETEFYVWDEDVQDWKPIGSEPPTAPGEYRVVVKVYDDKGEFVGEAWERFTIEEPTPVPKPEEPSTNPGKNDLDAGNGTGGLGQASEGAADAGNGAHLAKTVDLVPPVTLATLAATAFAAAAALAVLAALRRRRRS